MFIWIRIFIRVHCYIYIYITACYVRRYICMYIHTCGSGRAGSKLRRNATWFVDYRLNANVKRKFRNIATEFVTVHVTYVLMRNYASVLSRYWKTLAHRHVSGNTSLDVESSTELIKFRPEFWELEVDSIIQFCFVADIMTTCLHNCGLLHTWYLILYPLHLTP